MTDIHLSRTDRQRSVLGNARAYLPYGALRGAAGARLAYCGQLREVLTGGYLLGNGARVFNPQMMRFCSPDRSSPFGTGGINTYAYCQGDPVNYHDPEGRNRTVLNTTQSSGSTNSNVSSYMYGDFLEIALFVGAGMTSSKFKKHGGTLVTMLEYTLSKRRLKRWGVEGADNLQEVSKWDVAKLVAAEATSGAAFAMATTSAYVKLVDAATPPGQDKIISDVQRFGMIMANLAAAGASQVTDASVKGLSKKYGDLLKQSQEMEAEYWHMRSEGSNAPLLNENGERA